MVLFINLQTRMRSHLLGLVVWFLVGSFVYFHTSCVQTAKALARLRRCVGLPEPLLVAYVISTIISWAGSFHFHSSLWLGPFPQISSYECILFDYIYLFHNFWCECFSHFFCVNVFYIFSLWLFICLELFTILIFDFSTLSQGFWWKFRNFTFLRRIVQNKSPFPKSCIQPCYLNINTRGVQELSGKVLLHNNYPCTFWPNLIEIPYQSIQLWHFLSHKEWLIRAKPDFRYDQIISSPEPKAHRWASSIGRHPSSINIFKPHLHWSHEADSYQISHIASIGWGNE